VLCGPGLLASKCKLAELAEIGVIDLIRGSYLKRPISIRHVLIAGLRDIGACGLYGTGGWQPAWLPLFRRASRVYVALDRDATDRAIALARTFGIPRARARSPGGPRAEGRSQRLAAGGGKR
jgi:hypothetical protein